MSPAHPYDASIPVLTEVLQETPVEPPAAAHPPHHAHFPAAAAHQAEDTQALDDAQWAALERRLSEKVLQQLQSRVDFVLEQRIRDSMEEALNQAIKGLTSEIRHGLHEALGAIVSRAVSQELLHLQAQKK
ncbi:hypothetical protein GCM10027277_21160 [Pseudoduganella ginsengisoli]|uniref:DUF2486 family protein n=1 Tax=Pseudoduganella ginsengisoli TaxID=1462440 RepID=A0A6L6PSZ4_9BURK|nr:hypothetical protein [Pseudoduganella ginsengisoli]MTW00630.1 hypothetical protein [Pseudoduganella ginsengisoli]